MVTETPSWSETPQLSILYSLVISHVFVVVYIRSIHIELVWSLTRICIWLLIQQLELRFQGTRARSAHLQSAPLYLFMLYTVAFGLETKQCPMRWLQ